MVWLLGDALGRLVSFLVQVKQRFGSVITGKPFLFEGFEKLSPVKRLELPELPTTVGRS